MTRSPFFGFLLLLLLARSAAAEDLAILELRFTAVPPAVRGEIRNRVRTALRETGYNITAQVTARRRLKKTAGPTGCTVGPCLAEVGKTLKVNRALVGGVSGQGTSYDITMTMLETSGGTVLAQVNHRCDVCNFKEVNDATAATVLKLHKQTLVFLSKRATLVVESQPADADVLMDGLNAGKTPLTRILTPGPHTVVVAAEGHAAVTQQVQLEAGRTRNLSVALLPRGDRPAAVVTQPTKRSPTPGWIKWVVLGSGVVVGGVGGGLLALDGEEKSDPRYVHDTRAAGATMISLGAAAAVASTLIWLWERRRAPSKAATVGHVQ